MGNIIKFKLIHNIKYYIVAKRERQNPIEFIINFRRKKF